MVGKEAHVYKYADKQSMFFDCQITLTIKEPDQQYCDVPSCPDPPRRRRNHNESIAVQQSRLSTKPAELPPQKEEEPPADDFIITQDDVTRPSWMNTHVTFTDEDICMSGIGMTSMAFMNIILMGSSGLLFWNLLRIVKSF